MSSTRQGSRHAINIDRTTYRITTRVTSTYIAQVIIYRTINNVTTCVTSTHIARVIMLVRYCAYCILVEYHVGRHTKSKCVVPKSYKPERKFTLPPRYAVRKSIRHGSGENNTRGNRPWWHILVERYVCVIQIHIEKCIGISAMGSSGFVGAVERYSSPASGSAQYVPSRAYPIYIGGTPSF